MVHVQAITSHLPVTVNKVYDTGRWAHFNVKLHFSFSVSSFACSFSVSSFDEKEKAKEKAKECRKMQQKKKPRKMKQKMKNETKKQVDILVYHTWTLVVNVSERCNFVPFKSLVPMAAFWRHPPGCPWRLFGGFFHFIP